MVSVFTDSALAATRLPIFFGSNPVGLPLNVQIVPFHGGTHHFTNATFNFSSFCDAFLLDFAFLSFRFTILIITFHLSFMSPSGQMRIQTRLVRCGHIAQFTPVTRLILQTSLVFLLMRFPRLMFL